jgi:hypothetical protein
LSKLDWFSGAPERSNSWGNFQPEEPMNLNRGSRRPGADLIYKGGSEARLARNGQHVERNNAYCVGGSYQIFNLNCCFSLVSIDVALLTAYSVSDDIDWERPEPGLKKTGNGVRKSWVEICAKSVRF